LQGCHKSLTYIHETEGIHVSPKVITLSQKINEALFFLTACFVLPIAGSFSGVWNNIFANSDNQEDSKNDKDKL